MPDFKCSVKACFGNRRFFVVALSGSEGLSEAENGVFDLILLDYHLPDMTGVEVCRKLRARSELNNTSIAFITAVDKDKIIEEITTAGANTYINPPYIRKRVYTVN